MPTRRRIPRTFALLLAGILIGAVLTPLILRASQQLFALAPGDSIVVTCETSLGSTVQGAQARLECAPGAAGAPTSATVSEPSSSAVQLAGMRDGQQVSGTLDIEAVVRGDAAKVVFVLDGPQPAQHTEKRAPFFFLGDDDGQPRGWDTLSFPDGAYTLTVSVTFVDGATAESKARLKVANATHIGGPVSQPTPTSEAQRSAQTVRPGAPLPTPISGSAIANPNLQFGAAAHLFYINRDAPLNSASDVGFGWIRQQIHWRDLEGPEPGNYAWGELDPLVDSVNRAGFRLLLSVVRSPSFYTADGGDGMPDDPQPLGDFVAALAERYEGKVQAIEIWNEQNLAHENGGRVTVDDAGRYVELLKESYTRIKAVDPSITVLAGPPASTGVTDPALAVDDIAYLSAMYDYQGGVIRDFFDAQAVHPGASANPPDSYPGEKASPADGWTEHPTFYFRHIEDVRALMLEHGMDSKKVWITEFGWATQNNTPGYEFGNEISYEQQAEYITGAMELTRSSYPWVEAMFVWNLNFAPLKAQEGQPLNEQASFSLLDGAGRPRPAFYAVRRFLAETVEP